MFKVDGFYKSGGGRGGVYQGAKVVETAAMAVESRGGGSIDSGGGVVMEEGLAVAEARRGQRIIGRR